MLQTVQADASREVDFEKQPGLINVAPINVERELQMIVDRLIKTYTPQQVILFGSFAYGTPDQDSDLDLLILKDTKESPLRRRLTVRRLVAQPERRIPFSPLVLTPEELANRLALGDPFYQEILRSGKVLYATN
jgi:uncharacterized protein